MEQSGNAYYEVFSGKKHVCPNRSKSITPTRLKKLYSMMNSVKTVIKRNDGDISIIKF